MSTPLIQGIANHKLPLLFFPEPDNRHIAIEVPMYRAYCCCCFATFLVDKSTLSHSKGFTSREEVQLQDQVCRCGGAVYANPNLEPADVYWLVRAPGAKTYSAYEDISWLEGAIFYATDL